MKISGEFFVGTREATGQEAFVALDAATGTAIAPSFHAAGLADVDDACDLAWAAFEPYRRTSVARRAMFLERIADNIADLGDSLIVRAMTETGLPRQRLEGERQRTINQLRLFANVVRAGDWMALRIDTAQPERTPPRPDLRMRKIALGPVAVFGASNFPLAFSVAGGDTASALAAGCPIVVKGHPAHPGVSELVGRAIVAAVSECNLPQGVFSLLAGPSHELGRALVADPRIKAVAFTGSRAGGLALCAVAAARPEPVPVYAEMSSVNPVFLLPGALRADAERIAKGFVASVTLGAGQFCTNPGLVFAVEGIDFDRFATAAAAELSSAEGQTMLTPGIHEAYEDGVEWLSSAEGVSECGRGRIGATASEGRAALFVTDGRTFEQHPRLSREVFGPASLLVRVPDPQALIEIVDVLEGQLTASVHMREQDHQLAAQLIPALERTAGRIIANGWPTGVEVAHAMVHGGPFPATSDSRTTSVGSLAIDRFVRPVCYQDFPDALVPEALRDTTSDFERLVDGVHVNGDKPRRP